MKHYLLNLLTVAFLLIAGTVMAQDRVVTGKVTSAEDGQALPGVTITISGTSQGTVTDVEGNYRINVPSGATRIVFSFVGMLTVEEQISGREVINVALETDTKTLSEVVVIAYGTADKKSFTDLCLRLVVSK